MTDEIIPQRECRTCRQIKPLTSQYFRLNKRWFSLQCRDCENERSKLRRRKPNTKPLHRTKDGYKVCPKCERRLPATKEYFHKKENGIASHCKECRNAHNFEYAQEHKEQKREYSKKYRAINGEKLNAKSREWSKKNPERASQRTLKYKREYPERNTIRENNRRARKLSLPYTFTENDWQIALQYFGNKCAVCNKPPGLWHKIVMDHWIPIVSPECPGTTPMNIIPLCHGVGGCNNTKHDKNPIEWLTQKLGKRKAKKKLDEIQAYFEWIRNQHDTP